MTTNAAREAVERKSFEDWYTAGEPNNGFARCHGSDEYLLAPVRQAWQAWQARAALTTAAGAVKDSLTAAHALPPGIARDDTVHGEMYYTAAQVRAMLAQAAPQPAVQQGFDAVYAAALRDSKPGTIKDIAHLCWQAALATHPTAPVAQSRTDDEREEDNYTIRRMGQMLAEIAVIIKGTERARHRHGYADLPALVMELAAFKQAVLDPENQPSQFGTTLFAAPVAQGEAAHGTGIKKESGNE